MRIFPSNNGVVLRMEHRAPNEPHAMGTVLGFGGGVPWLTYGDRVLYLASEATEQWVPWADYDRIPRMSGSTPTPEQEMVFVIDQRHIHAKLDEPMPLRDGGA